MFFINSCFTSLKTKVFDELLKIFKLLLSRKFLSITILNGLFPFHKRTVREGLSSSAVFAPISIEDS